MTQVAITDQLTEEQCEEFRRMPGSFNEMVRAIYRAGFYKGALAALERSESELGETVTAPDSQSR